MFTTSDPMLPTKKKLTTYGKASRKSAGKFPPSGTQDTMIATKASQTSSRQAGEFDGPATRSASRSVSPVKRSAPTKQSSQQPLKKTTDLTSHRQNPNTGQENARVVKRKQSQGQPTTRQVKKQRSSSPDSAIYDEIPSPKLAPRANPILAKPVRPFSQKKSTPPKDTIMQGVGVTSPFSPATSKNLDVLSVGARKTKPAQHQIPIRPPRKAPVEFGPALTKEKPVETLKNPEVIESKSRPAPRRRLIDALAAQAESSDSAGDDSASDGEAVLVSGDFKPGPISSQSSDTGREQNTQPAATPSRPRAMMSRETSLLSKKAGVKFTYSQERTVLAENSLLDATGSEVDFWSQSLLPDSQPKSIQMSADDDLEDGLNPGAVRSLHELRQAGANNRTADEMDDIIDRIGTPGQGKPSSTRRTALLELSQKIQDKTFRRQFRDHDGESALLAKIGNEGDIIAAYTVVSILVTLLASPPTSSNLIQQLQFQGISRLFALLLAEERDITTMGKDRKNNLSKHTQTTVTSLKTTILNIPKLWDHAPPQLPPRTLALKCLDQILPPGSQAMTIEHDIATTAIVDELFAILSEASDDVDSYYWDFPHRTESINLSLALSLLVKQSVPVMQSDLGAEWTSRHLPTVANVLEASLLRKHDGLGELDVSALKLTMNTANNNPEAPGIFLKSGVLRELAGVACQTFAEVLKPAAEDAFQPATLDSLVLMLGVMINFAEHDPAAGRTLLDSEQGTSSLESLIRLFLDNYTTTHEADSEESTRLNVLFGYLSVLLGYLAVYQPVRERFAAQHRGGNLRPLVGAIQEFIDHYNKVADHTEVDSSMGRLQALVDLLEVSY